MMAIAAAVALGESKSLLCVTKGETLSRSSLSHIHLSLTTISTYVGTYMPLTTYTFLLNTANPLEMSTSNPDTMAQPDLKSLFDFGGGDILVAVTSNNERFLINVSSSALCLASPVWRKFIYPPFPTLPGPEGESAKEPDARIDFTEDDCEALLVLFRLAHLQFKKIPDKLPYETLLQVAVLCDLYNCVDLVRPWLHTWLRDEDKKKADDDSDDERDEDESKNEKKTGREGWLFIAWTFGRPKLFAHAAKHILLNLKYGEDGRFS